MAVFTTSVPYDMKDANLNDLFDGTVTFSSSTEVDVTGASGAHYVLTGTDLTIFNSHGVPVVNVSTLSINGQTEVTGLSKDAVDAMAGFNWTGAFAGGTNSITGSSGDDVLTGGFGIGNRTTVYGGAGNDTLIGGSGEDVLVAGHGNDLIEGNGGHVSATADFRYATAGVSLDLKNVANGTVDAPGLGTDTLVGINGLGGTKFADTLIGDANNNVLIGHGGFDHLSGNLGDDTLIVTSADVRLNGGPGDDTLIFRSTAGIIADLNNYKSIESVQGTNADDVITGTDHNETFSLLGGDDVLHAGGGRDTIIASTGTDVIDGGDGSDTIDYSRSHHAAVTVDLSNAAPQDVGSENGIETLISVENVIGTHQNDVLTGNAEANYLSGGPNGGLGNDTIDGGAGNDTIYGGYSADTLTGGAGADNFLYFGGEDSLAHSYDTITDFDASQDHIEIGFAINSVTTAGGDYDKEHLSGDLDHQLGMLAASTAVLLTPTSGDLAGQTFLVANYDSFSALAGDVLIIHFGSASNLAGFGTQDFIL